ncbi:alpha-ketoglutarate-dependent dioxygenase AlkB family protein [Bernardetia sp.]|uniref:alpha-ketoglutarate-dependent dioxygenase AlkB family protein n=1 Tax=Bernardetia sp. TaxID=1937974 RepID=UPI0025C71D02|nr:alpha-ketoglutarate-dependent dioxygenase AlkB [Bernardetia sp.]
MNLFNSSQSPFILPKKDEYSCSKTKELFNITIPNGKLIFIPNFLDEKISSELMDYFLETENESDWKSTDWRTFEKENLAKIKFKNIDWQHNQIKIFGKMLFEPRFSAWYGDKDANYSYSNLKLEPNSWNEKLLFVKNEIEKLISISELENIKFNSVLMNWYRDGQDSMGWHSDNEKELGRNPVIASLNFGAARRFLFRNIKNKKEKVEFSLQNGLLLIMAGEIQHFWQHAIPKEAKIKTNRINLTFRTIKL